MFGDSLKPISRREAGVEPTWTYLRRGKERSTEFSALSNYFQSFVVYLQKAVDGNFEARIIRRLLRRNGLQIGLFDAE